MSSCLPPWRIWVDRIPQDREVGRGEAEGLRSEARLLTREASSPGTNRLPSSVLPGTLSLSVLLPRASRAGAWEAEAWAQEGGSFRNGSRAQGSVAPLCPWSCGDLERWA